MKKKILVLSLVLVFILSALSVSADSALKKFINSIGIFDNNKTSDYIDYKLNVDAELESRINTEGNTNDYANETLTVAPNTKVDFKASVDMGAVSGALGIIDAQMTDEIKDAFDNAYIKGSFTIKVDLSDAGAKFNIPNDYITVSDMAKGFSADPVGETAVDLEDLYVFNTRNYSNGVFTMNVEIKDKLTVEEARNKISNLYFELLGVEVIEPGTITTKLSVTGSTTLYTIENDSNENIGTINYTFKQKSDIGYASGKDTYIDPEFEWTDGTYVHEEDENEIPIQVTTKCAGAYISKITDVDEKGQMEVTVSVANNPGIQSLNWELGFDEELLEPVYNDTIEKTFWGTSITSITPAPTYVTNLEATGDEKYAGGPVYITVASASKENPIDGDGKVFTATFKVNDNVTYDEKKPDFDFTLTIGEVTVDTETTNQPATALETEEEWAAGTTLKAGSDANKFGAKATGSMRVSPVSLTVTGLENVAETKGIYVKGSPVTLPASSAENTEATYNLSAWYDAESKKTYNALLNTTADKIIMNTDTVLTPLFKHGWKGSDESPDTPLSSYYFAVETQDADTGSVTASPTGQKNLYRSSNAKDSVYFAEIDLTNLTSDNAPFILRVQHRKVCNPTILAISEITSSEYATIANGAETTNFSKENIPDGTNKVSVDIGVTLPTEDNSLRFTDIDITSFIEEKLSDSNNPTSVYIMINNTKTGDWHDNNFRMCDFNTTAHITYSKTPKVTATFSYKNYTYEGYENLDAGTNINLPTDKNTADSSLLTGWQEDTNGDGVGDDTILLPGAEYSLTSNKTFVAVEEESIEVTLYDCDVDKVEVKKGTTIAQLAANEAIEKTSAVGSYALRGFLDESTNTVYEKTSNTALNDGETLTALWNYVGETSKSVNFDLKKVVKYTSYATSSGTYDYTVESVTDASGTVDNNVNGIPTGSNYVYLAIDLTNEKPAEAVLFNLTGTSEGSATLNVEVVDNIPQTGGTVVSGTKIVDSVSYTSEAIALNENITTVYNNAIGSTLYLKVYGIGWAANKGADYSKIDADSINLTVTTQAVNSALATFKDESGNVVDIIPMYSGETIIMPSAEDKGIEVPVDKIFDGWYDGSTTHAEGVNVTLNADTEFTAKFSEASTAKTVSFVTKITNEISDVPVAEGGTTTLPSAANVEDFTFIGWVIDDSDASTNDIIEAGTTTDAINENTTYIAAYTKEIKFSETIAFVPTSVDSEDLAKSGTAYLNYNGTEIKVIGDPKKETATTYARGIIGKMDVADFDNIIGAEFSLPVYLRKYAYFYVYEMKQTDYETIKNGLTFENGSASYSYDTYATSFPVQTIATLTTGSDDSTWKNYDPLTNLKYSVTDENKKTLNIVDYVNSSDNLYLQVTFNNNTDKGKQMQIKDFHATAFLKVTVLAQ